MVVTGVSVASRTVFHQKIRELSRESSASAIMPSFLSSTFLHRQLDCELSALSNFRRCCNAGAKQK
jgi:hypothetical protein